MKYYRHPWIITAVTLSLFCMVLLAPIMELPAMGQPGYDAALTDTASDDAASPSQAKTATDSEAEPPEVVKVMLTSTDAVIEAERGRGEEIISQIFQSEPVYEKAIVKRSDGARRTYPIRYDFDSLDESRTGLTWLTGYITPDDGCSISAELAEVVLPVFLYDPDAPCEMPAVSMDLLSRTQIVLPEHAVLQDLEKMTQNGILDSDFYYSLEGDLTWSAEISWDFSKVKFGTPGTYQAAASPMLPDGILLPESLPEQTCDIVIQEDGPLLLAPPEFTGLYMTSEWTKETPDPGLFRCFYAIGDGEWQEDVEQDLISIPRFTPYYLEVFYYEDVFFETPYYFQISYDGEYSNILKVYFTEGRIHYRLYDGDRDGGDREDQTPPDISQTVPPTGGSSETGPAETTKSPETGHSSNDNQENSGGDRGSSSHKDSSSHGNSSSHRDSSSHGDLFSHGDSSPGSDTASGPGYNPLAGPSPTAGTPIANPAAAPAGTAVFPADNDPGDSPSEKGTSSQNTGASALLEEDTADYVVLSGKRLKKYMELHPGQPLLITKHRIQLEIPLKEDSVLSSLKDQSLLRAELLALSEHTIQVELSIDGVPVSSEDMPELTITMPRPASEENSSLQAAGPDGTVLAEAQAVDDARIRFTVKQTGTFRIQMVPDGLLASNTENVLSEERTSSKGQPVMGQPTSSHTDYAVLAISAVLTVLVVLAALAVLAVRLLPSSRFRIHRFNRRPDKSDKKGDGKQ